MAGDDSKTFPQRQLVRASRAATAKIVTSFTNEQAARVAHRSGNDGKNTRDFTPRARFDFATAHEPGTEDHRFYRLLFRRLPADSCSASRSAGQTIGQQQRAAIRARARHRRNAAAKLKDFPAQNKRIRDHVARQHSPIKHPRVLSRVFAISPATTDATSSAETSSQNGTVMAGEPQVIASFDSYDGMLEAMRTRVARAPSSG